MATAIIRQIHELTYPRQNCQGCQSQHPSQKQHMGLGGCLSAEQPTWEELCNQYWQVARSLIRDDEVQNLAKQAASRIPELQVFICIISLRRCSYMTFVADIISISTL